MIDFDFIIHYASYFIPTFPIWDSYLQYIKGTNKSTHFYKKYNLLFCPYYFLWSCLYYQYGLGPSLVCLFLHSKGNWATLFMGLFYTSISPPPIAPQIFILIEEGDLTEIVEKCISPFDRSNEMQLKSV